MSIITMTSFIHYLRSRPLGQRYLILWIGSALTFLLVVWIWLGQLESRLASLNPDSIAAFTQKEVVQEEEGAWSKLSTATASFISFLKGQRPKEKEKKEEKDESSPSKQAPSQRLQEGDELQQFLPAKPFPE